ncbi:MAG TPA: energy transducer TonB [Gemmatimonadaceae bacterium]|jgi:TonB family protein
MSMHLLLSDVQRPQRSLIATSLSVVLHAGAVVVLAMTGERMVNAVAGMIEETVQYLYPARRDIGPLKPGQLSASAPRDARTTGDETPRWRDGQPGAGGQGVGAHEGIIFAPLPSESESVEPGVGDNAFSTVEVDSIAVVDPTSEGPEYPTAMAARKLEGSTVLRFVVDSTGTIDMSTVRVISATHSAFAKAVIAAMPRMKYRPASIDGHPVRLLVEQAFAFRLQKPKGQIA